ncbi:galectin-9-like [Gastrophryne carolinensis]
MSCGPVYSPPVPFTTHFHGGLKDGTLVVISGSVQHSGDRFAVNFQCGPDIAFHFNPRFDGSLVVCNTKEHQNWGKEERKNELPFHRGHPFELRILVTHHDYKVSVNRNHFLEYHHRIPFHRVQNLEINGCVSLSCVDIQAQGKPPYLPPTSPAESRCLPIPLQGLHLAANCKLQHALQQRLTFIGGGFPQQPFPGGHMQNPAFPPQLPGCYPNQFPGGHCNYTLPYETKIHGGLFPNKSIVIRGTVSGHPKRFHINLKFHGGTAFHFNPRFDERTIVRNSKLNNSWGSEERQMPSCGMCFAPGQSFVIEITAEHHAFRVNVNGSHVCNFNYRVPHLQQIDTLQIDGDIVLQHVQI